MPSDLLPRAGGALYRRDMPAVVFDAALAPTASVWNRDLGQSRILDVARVAIDEAVPDWLSGLGRIGDLP